MSNLLSRMFVEHPRSVDETYLQHMRFAGGFAGRLLLAGAAAAVHAVVPCLFEKTASGIIEDLHARMHNRG